MSKADFTHRLRCIVPTECVVKRRNTLILRRR